VSYLAAPVITYGGSMSGAHGDHADHADHGEPTDYTIADLVPEQFDAIPPYASTETKWLYIEAAAIQLGQIAATAWG
jgi:hypothetical protein